jgi:hypothetical protein
MAAVLAILIAVAAELRDLERELPAAEASERESSRVRSRPASDCWNGSRQKRG